MDNASDYGSEDSRFDSWLARNLFDNSSSSSCTWTTPKLLKLWRLTSATKSSLNLASCYPAAPSYILWESERPFRGDHWNIHNEAFSGFHLPQQIRRKDHIGTPVLSCTSERLLAKRRGGWGTRKRKAVRREKARQVSSHLIPTGLPFTTPLPPSE